MEDYFGFNVTNGQAMMYAIKLVHTAKPKELPFIAIPTGNMADSGLYGSSYELSDRAYAMYQEIYSWSQMTRASCSAAIIVSACKAIKQARLFTARAQLSSQPEKQAR